MAPMAPLVSLEEAQRAVLVRARPLPAERVDLRECAGRVLAETARAAVDLPPFDSSAMDGFAVRAADTPGVFAVEGESAAGRPLTGAVAPGRAAAIATGGVVPAGADAVVPIEYVVKLGNEVEISEPAKRGANVRPRGGDVRAGAAVVAAGTALGAAQVGALAAAGVATVVCARRPRAAVVTTGTELRAPGEPLAPGEIYEANGSMLAVQLRSAGAHVGVEASVQDDEDAHRAALENGLGCDVLVTSGGVSVGEHDLVRRVEADLGVQEVFWGVAVRPGKPVSFGVRGSALVFGLPGNPVSALVAFELFVRPALAALQGASEPLPSWELGLLSQALGRNASRDELVRARTRATDEGSLLEPVLGQESHMIARAAGADALVLVPRGDGELAAGSRARYLRLR
jgi:molybdopterin molybdotransferase